MCLLPLYIGNFVSSHKPSISVVVVSVIFAIVVVLGPFVWFRMSYLDVVDTTSENVAATTVAVGAIFRSNSRNFLKSTFMSAVRTALRTWIRRMVRLALPILLRVFLPLLSTKKKKNAEDIQQPIGLAMVLGFVALWISFYGVITLHHNVGTEVLFGFSLGVCATMAACTYLLHAMLLWGFSHKYETNFRVATSIEGVLLQGYFTGALSYLPLASDLSIEGSPKRRFDTHMWTIMTMLVVSFVLHAAGEFFSVPLLLAFATHMLLYVFVISFPLKPLDGSGLFAYSKRMWFLVFVLVMLCFLRNMPEHFYGIL